MKKGKYNFGGYATKSGVKCTDGRTILPDAFKGNDGQTVPLVWQHQHSEPDNVLGHALLENRADGVYAWFDFNDTPSGQNAKTLVEHKDIKWLSIYANGLVEEAKKVMHGVIREVSLVLAGANPGALIDFLAFEHSDGSVVTSEDEAVIFSGVDIEFEPKPEPAVKHADGGSSDDKTVKEVFDTLTEEQKTAVYAIIGAAVEGGDESVAQSADDENSDDEGDNKVMKQNVFEGSALKEKERPHLTHAQFDTIVADAKKLGSFKQAFLAHAAEFGIDPNELKPALQHAGTYGIDNIDYLFPDARTITTEPTFITRDMRWVSVVLNGTRHTPFSRIKSVQADITVDTARAMGYVKGALKHDEVFGLLKRTTTPTTVYKKQKLDRDDIIDITDFDVVVWLKAEMRVMLNEEIARAALIGDGRSAPSEDKIDEACIRPVWTDADLYSHHILLPATDDLPAEVIDKIILARVNYKASGNPTMFTSESFLTSMLLIKDDTGRRIYKTVADLEAELRVSSIVPVPQMEGLERTVDTVVRELLAILVSLPDYTFGADKGGQISLFDDFDIDYNQQKYLIETRCSGALTLPKSALVIERTHA